MEMSWLRRVLVSLFLLLSLPPGKTNACNMQSCSNEFIARNSRVPQGSPLPYCVHLREYMKCVLDQAKACHGNLMYHGTEISIETMMQKNNCEEILADEEKNYAPGDKDWELAYGSAGIPHNDPCGYKNTKSNPAHCGLFGDPHLKTFDGTFMTCRVKGAWPMLSSSHLAIQVTNEEVAPDFKATATTKVTVLIKGSSSCGTAKTYEASGESLPKAFVDGTTFSGNQSSPFANVTESHSGRHVLIKLRTIDATVSIRRVGKYLSVSVTLPEELVEEMRESMQLCITGCPQSEILMEGSIESPQKPVMSESEALSRCLEYNVTDYYLDSCVFDLVTTGDLTFREAASLSLKDLLAGDPGGSYSILKNCSSWPCVWSMTSAAMPQMVILPGTEVPDGTAHWFIGTRKLPGHIKAATSGGHCRIKPV